MSAPPAALAHKAAANRLAADAQRGARSEWAAVDPDHLRRSWTATLPRVVTIVVGAQLAAAQLSEPFLRELAGPGPVAAPGALAGIASDGRPLDTLLAQPMITALSYLAAGRPMADALAAGLAALELIVGTQVHDTARVADLVGVTARPGVAYTRVVTLPACPRCIVLAGREYPYSEGFERHPACDCAVLPMRSGDAVPLTARELFDAMSPAEQVRRFGAAAAEAIREGADIGQVVNARRGMATAGGRLFTREGTTRRGYAGRRLVAESGSARRPGDRFARATLARPMPEQIIADASSRDEAIAALMRFGYLTPAPLARRRDPVELAPPAPEPPAPAPVPDSEPPVPVDGRISAADLVWHDDDALAEQLMAAFAEDRMRDAEVIEAELEGRAALAEAPPAEADIPPDETDAERARREREDAEYAEMQRLVEEEGYDWEHAAAEAQGRTVEAIRREQYLLDNRAAGDSRPFRDVAREQYRLYVARQIDAAEDATRGYLLTNEARAAGVDSETLFSGPRARAERWASEELLRWWDTNGRLTFQDFVAEIESGRGTDAGRDYNR